MNMNVKTTRRALLGGAALVGAALVAGCSPAQIQQFETQWASVAGTIQNAVATAAKYVPTIESIAATAASLFGPQYAALVQVGTAAFNQIVQTLISVVGSLSPPAAARLSVRLRGTSPNLPIVVGVTTSGVRVTGWKSSF